MIGFFFKLFMQCIERTYRNVDMLPEVGDDRLRIRVIAALRCFEIIIPDTIRYTEAGLTLLTCTYT